MLPRPSPANPEDVHVRGIGLASRYGVSVGPIRWLPNSSLTPPRGSNASAQLLGRCAPSRLIQLAPSDRGVPTGSVRPRVLPCLPHQDGCLPMRSSSINESRPHWRLENQFSLRLIFVASNSQNRALTKADLTNSPGLPHPAPSVATKDAHRRIACSPSRESPWPTDFISTRKPKVGEFR